MEEWSLPVLREECAYKQIDPYENSHNDSEDEKNDGYYDEDDLPEDFENYRDNHPNQLKKQYEEVIKGLSEVLAEKATISGLLIS